MSGMTVVVLCNMGWKAELFLQVTSLCTTIGVCVGKMGGSAELNELGRQSRD